MSVSVQDTPLFALPLELRELIYKRVLASPAHGPALLQTCRAVHLEAHKFLFQRPLHFDGQLDLHRWLDHAPPELLTYTKELSISIQDVDMRPLLRPQNPVQLSSSGQLLTWQLYEAELDRLKHALKKLPNVKTITLIALSHHQSFLYREFLTKVLWLLSSLYPHLEDLRLEGNLHYQDLMFLSRLDRLQSFSFDGFSSSSPAETATVLASLEHLTQLSIVSQSALLTPDHQLHSGFTSKRQSLTGDVLRTVNKLASFSVTERTPRFSSTLFFTPEVLASLHNHRSLNSLSIALSRAPDTEVLLSLEALLESSPIEELELDWPQLDPLVLESYTLLSGALRMLWVRAASAASAFEILWSIAECRETGDLSAMEKVVLVRSMEEYGGGGVGHQGLSRSFEMDRSPDIVSLPLFNPIAISGNVHPSLCIVILCSGCKSWADGARSRALKASTTPTWPARERIYRAWAFRFIGARRTLESVLPGLDLE
jgi:hypothetical protein